MSARLRLTLLLALLAALLEGAFLLLRRLHPLDKNVVEVIAVALGASVIYFVAAFLALRWRQGARSALAVVFLAAVVFRVTLLPLPPTLSHDLYRYVWEGEAQRAGHNPYLVAPADLPGSPAHLPGHDVPAAYAPLTELAFWLAAHVGGWLAFKGMSVAFDLGTLALVAFILHRRREPLVRALLYAWCPLVVLEFAGSGHNDSLAVFLLLLANALIIGRRAGVSIAALAAAGMSKWFALLAAPVFLRRARWWGGPVLAATIFVLALPYLEAGTNLLHGFMVYAEKWRNNASLYDLVAGVTGLESVATGVALGAIGGLALHLAGQRAEPLRASFLLVAGILLLSPSVFPWYVTWLVPFLCFFPQAGLLLFTATVLLSYHVLIGFTALAVWEYSPALVWLEYLPVYALLLWGGWRTARGGTARDRAGETPL